MCAQRIVTPYCFLLEGPCCSTTSQVLPRDKSTHNISRWPCACLLLFLDGCFFPSGPWLSMFHTLSCCDMCHPTQRFFFFNRAQICHAHPEFLNTLLGMCLTLLCALDLHSTSLSSSLSTIPRSKSTHDYLRQLLGSDTSASSGITASPSMASWLSLGQAMHVSKTTLLPCNTTTKYLTRPEPKPTPKPFFELL